MRHEMGNGAWIELRKQFVKDDLALLGKLIETLPLLQQEIRLYGRTSPVPRLTSWHGDAGRAYKFSGKTLNPSPWTPELVAIRDTLPGTYNSVLANLYRHGNDSVAWHADDEPELGAEPTIASVSLGTARRFILRHNVTKETREFTLGNGDLLVMGGKTQQDWQHSVPKTTRPVHGMRMNLTFRKIECDCIDCQIAGEPTH